MKLRVQRVLVFCAAGGLAIAGSGPATAQYSTSLHFDSATASVMKGNIAVGPNRACDDPNDELPVFFPSPFVFRDNDPNKSYLYQSYELYNNGPERCVEVTAKWHQQDCDMRIGLALYDGSFDPNDPTENLIAHTFDFGHDFFDFGPFYNEYYYTPGFFHAAGIEYHLDFVEVEAVVPALSKLVLVFDSLEQPGSLLTCPRDGSGAVFVKSEELTDKALEVTVNDSSNYELDGNPTMTFYVSLSAKLAVPFSVDYSAFATGIGPGLAIAGTDFQAISNTLTFQPGETLKLVEVPILPDMMQEPDETFGFELSNPNPPGVAIVDGTVTGTIFDNDDPNAICHIAAPAAGALPTGKVGEPYGPVDFSPGGPYTEFEWEVVDPTALPDGIQFSTFVAGDTFDHGSLAGSPTESGFFSFDVHLTCMGLENLVDHATVTFSLVVEPEDPPVIITVTDVAVLEGDAGNTDALPLIELSAPLPNDLLLEVITADATATESDSDYQPVPPAQLIQINAGTTTTPIPLSVIGDTEVELDEQFTVELRTPIEQLFIGEAVVTIINDDQLSGSATEVPTLGGIAAGALIGLLGVAGILLSRRRGL